MNHLSTLSSVQHLLESSQVRVLCHRRAHPRFIVSQRGITVDPLKVQAITEIPPP
jgi:hypothetical protein